VSGSCTTVSSVGSLDPFATSIDRSGVLCVEEFGSEDRHGLVKGKGHLSAEDIVIRRGPFLLLDDETFADVLFQVVIQGMALMGVKDTRAFVRVASRGPSTHMDSVTDIANVVTVVELTKVDLLLVSAGRNSAAYQEGEQNETHWEDSFSLGDLSRAIFMKIHLRFCSRSSNSVCDVRYASSLSMLFTLWVQ